MRFKRGLAGLAGVAAAIAVGAAAPSTALAHPCTETWTLTGSAFLSANDAGSAWAGSIPAIVNDDDCATINPADGFITAKAKSAAAAEPVEEAVSTFTYTSNLTPLGYSKRVPPVPTSYAGMNSDMAFKGNYVFQGHWSGFRVIDVSDPKSPTQVYNTEDCHHNSGQGDVVVHGNILVRTWDAVSNATHTCMGQTVGAGFEGIHIFDISDPKAPVLKKQVRMSTDNGAGAPTTGCGAHTATAVPDDARGYLYLYVGGSSTACSGMDIVRIKISDMTDAQYLYRADHGRRTSTGGGQGCHDNNVLMGVGGTSIGYAMCAGSNGLAMYKFDMSKPADAVGTPASPGGIERPTVIWTKSMGVTTGHSGSFTYDGKTLIYGHEPGGGGLPNCQASSSTLNKTLFFLNPETGDTQGTFIHPRPQGATENCTWHNFNVVPTYKGYYAVSGSYQSGISVFDFTNPAAVKEVAYADPAPLNTTGSNIVGGDWSTHFYNGKIYESDIRRGLIVWDLDHELMRRVRTPDLTNPQTQIGGFAQDLEGATIASTDEGKGFKLGSTAAPQFTCTDGDSGVESCTASVTSLDTGSIGNKSYTVTAKDKAGNVTTKTVAYLVNSADFPGQVGGTVPATLSLTMGAPATFPTFVPGLAREYTATTEPTVISTAGDAALSVSDPSTTNTGHLVNGTFSLPQPLQGLGTVKTYTAPVSGDKPLITFKQAIGANDALRTGTYSKTLTFTLSTTTP